MNQPVGQADADRPQDVILHVPGPWRHFDALARALPAGFELQCGRLRRPDGSMVRVELMPPSPGMREILPLAHEAPLSKSQANAVLACPRLARVSGPGGCEEAARYMHETGVALLDAGGVGVFVENCLRLFLAEQWRRADEMQELFVSVFIQEDEVWTVGMHTLGLRDVTVPVRRDKRSAQLALLAFVGISAQPDVLLEDGEGFRGPGYDFTIHQTTCSKFSPGDPSHNPYGQWRLELHPQGDAAPRCARRE